MNIFRFTLMSTQEVCSTLLTLPTVELCMNVVRASMISSRCTSPDASGWRLESPGLFSQTIQLAQLGRYQRGAAERLVIKIALLSVIQLLLENHEQCHLDSTSKEEALDTIYLCGQILTGEKS